MLAWMGSQADTDLFITALTVAEIRRGVLEKPKGRKRDRREAWFAGAEGPQALSPGASCRSTRRLSWCGRA